MNPLLDFHTKAYGKSYYLSETAPYYDALIEEGKKGFHFEAEGLESFETFLSVWTMTLYLTQRGQVHLIVPPGLWPWVQRQMNSILRHMVKVRLNMGASREDLKYIETATQKVLPVKKVFGVQRPPEQWLSYGTTTPPKWIEEQTLVIPKK